MPKHAFSCPIADSKSIGGMQQKSSLLFITPVGLRNGSKAASTKTISAFKWDLIDTVVKHLLYEYEYERDICQYISLSLVTVFIDVMPFCNLLLTE